MQMNVNEGIPSFGVGEFASGRDGGGDAAGLAQIAGGWDGG